MLMKYSELDKQQLRTLRAMAHALKPVVRIGQHGLVPGVTQELEIALDHHELVKVKLAADGREARDAQVESLRSQARAVVIQQIGNTATLYRRNKKKSVIDFSVANR